MFIPQDRLGLGARLSGAFIIFIHAPGAAAGLPRVAPRRGLTWRHRGMEPIPPPHPLRVRPGGTRCSWEAPGIPRGEPSPPSFYTRNRKHRRSASQARGPGDASRGWRERRGGRLAQLVPRLPPPRRVSRLRGGEGSGSGAAPPPGSSKPLFQRLQFAARLPACSDEKARRFFPPRLASCPKTNCPPLGCTL